MTTEFRHKTIVPAVLITPRRGRVLAAKLITLAGAGLVFGLAASGIAAAITMPVLASRHIGSGIDGSQLAAIIIGSAAATAIGAALGVGAGAIIRNQVGAIITLLSVLYVAEPLLGFIPHVGPAVQEFGIGGLATGASGTTDFPVTSHLLAQAPAVAVLAATPSSRCSRRGRAPPPRHHRVTGTPHHALGAPEATGAPVSVRQARSGISGARRGSLRRFVQAEQQAVTGLVAAVFGLVG